MVLVSGLKIMIGLHSLTVVYESFLTMIDESRGTRFGRWDRTVRILYDT